jgi:hypothetical protein
MDDTNTGVLWILFREIADEGHAVFVVLVLSVLYDLGGTCLTGDGYEFALCLALSPATDGCGTKLVVPHYIV